MKKLISISVLIIIMISYLFGFLQFWLFGDFTYRLGNTLHIQEDGEELAKMIETRWKIVHWIDQF